MQGSPHYPSEETGLPQLSSARRPAFPLAELSGLGRHLKREVVWVDGDGVCHGEEDAFPLPGNRAAAPVPMAANTSAEAELRQERPTRGCRGAPSPHGAGAAAAAPPGPPHRGEVGRWGCAPLPARLRVPVPGEARCPLHQRILLPCSQLWFQPGCSAGRALAVQTRGRGCSLQGGAVGPERVSAEPLALPQHSPSGAWGVPFTHSAASSLLLPVHPSPSCGTASLQGWHDLGSSTTPQIFTVKLCPEATSPFSSSSLLHLQPPWQG